MSARRAFVLGAIVGAGVLAAVGAVSAGSVSKLSISPIGAVFSGECPPITVLPEKLAAGSEIHDYEAQLTASGGAAPYTWGPTGEVFPGIQLDGQGKLQGVPTQSGTFSFQVTATDANGCQGTRTYTVTVTPVPPDAKSKLTAIYKALLKAQKLSNSDLLDINTRPPALQAVELQIRKLKIALASSDFPNVYGRTFGFWYEKFECIDLKIANPFREAPAEKAELIKEALTCAEDVTKLLKQVPETQEPSGTKDTDSELYYVKEYLKLAADDFGRGQWMNGARLLRTVKAFKMKFLANGFPNIYGDTFRAWFVPLECIDEQMNSFVANAIGSHSEIRDKEIAKAMDCFGTLERKLLTVKPAEQVTISEDDTWTHNPAIGKTNICINVRTTPPQPLVSATLTGPGGYSAAVYKRPLHADGTGQIRGVITQPGDYTKTIVVLDANGKYKAKVTKTFTVAAPPQDGPATTPPCPKPTQ